MFNIAPNHGWYPLQGEWVLRRRQRLHRFRRAAMFLAVFHILPVLASIIVPIALFFAGEDVNSTLALPSAPPAFTLALPSAPPAFNATDLQAVDMVNRRTGGNMVNRRTGGNEGAAFDGTDLIGNTKIFNSLPELDVSSALANSAGKYNNVDWAESEMLYGLSTSAATAGVKNLSSSDRQLPLTRTMESLMQGKADPEIDSDLVFDSCAPKLSSGTGSLHLKGGPSEDAIVFTADWAENLYGQSTNAVTTGVKNLLSSDRQLTTTAEAMMEGKPDPKIDSYLVFNPCAPKLSSGACSSHLKGPSEEATIFMIGFGNNTADWAENLYGQSTNAVTAGVKNILSSDGQQTRTAEAVMEGKPDPAVDSYLVFDPSAPLS